MLRFISYLSRHLWLSVAAVWFLLTSMDLCFLLLNEWRFVGIGDYQGADALTVVLLSLPHSLENWLELSCFLGSLLGLGSLQQHHELVIWRIAGVSIYKLATLIAIITFIGSLLALSLLWTIAPEAYQAAQRLKNDKMHQGQISYQAGALWIHDPPYLVRLKNIRADGTCTDLRLYRFDSMPAMVEQEWIHIEKAEYHDDQWQLYGIKSYQLFSDRIVQGFEEKKVGHFSFRPHTLLTQGIKKLETFSLKDIWRHLQDNPSSQWDYRILVWTLYEKISAPFRAVIFVLLAIPFILGPLRSGTAGLRWILGLLSGFILYIAQNGFAHTWLAQGWNPFWGMMIPLLCCMFTAMIGLYKVSQ